MICQKVHKCFYVFLFDVTTAGKHLQFVFCSRYQNVRQYKRRNSRDLMKDGDKIRKRKGKKRNNGKYITIQVLHGVQINMGG